jgi:predicted transcriptional regulator
VKVGEIMHKGVMTVAESTPLQEVTRFFIDHGITGAPVVDAQGKPQGVISMSDLTAHAAGLDQPKEGAFLRELWDDASHHQLQDLTFEHGVTARDVMTDFLIRVEADTPVRELMELMKSARLHRVFVTRKDVLVGIVTTLDLVMLLDRLLAEREVTRST